MKPNDLAARGVRVKAQTRAEADRDRLAAELDEAQAQVEALRGHLEYIAGASDLEGHEPGMWAINRARNALAALPAPPGGEKGGE